MSFPNKLPEYISEQQYLEDEKFREFKSEYIDGEIYPMVDFGKDGEIRAMAGAGKNHQRLIFNLCGELYSHLKGTPCEAFSSDTKVRADTGKKYFYPDIVVTCEKETDNDSDYVELPRIIVEVLSESTRKYDKTFKRLVYQTIPSLEEYVLIEQDRVKIEVARRSQTWQSSFYFLGDDVTFESIDLTLSVSDIYQRVENDEMRAFFVQSAT
jgi:Uma2 family endonuclease